MSDLLPITPGCQAMVIKGAHSGTQVGIIALDNGREYPGWEGCDPAKCRLWEIAEPITMPVPLGLFVQKIVIRCFPECYLMRIDPDEGQFEDETGDNLLTNGKEYVH